MSLHEAHFSIDTSEGELEVLGQFDVDAETYPAEPTSWGASRGTETAYTVELYTWNFGGRVMSRDDLIQILSKAEVEKIETEIARGINQ